MTTDLFQKNDPQRQKLMAPLAQKGKAQQSVAPSVENLAMALPSTAHTVAPEAVRYYIQDIDHLYVCLLDALKLELSTIPPYLCALYSIHEGSNEEAAQLIRSVVVEEMLHMIMVANIFNAVSPKGMRKGQRLFDTKTIMPVYPTPLPGNIVPTNSNGEPREPPFRVSLLKFSQQALDEFLIIEQPANPKAAKQKPTFDSIGQFYHALRWGIKNLNDSTKGGIFTGNPARQVGREHYYGSGGKVVKVHNFDDAEQAFAEIVGQGEGVENTIEAAVPLFGEGIEYAHYFKFQEINYRRFYNANDTNFMSPLKSIPTGKSFEVSWSSVYNIKDNPTIKDYRSNPTLLEKALAFNRVYTQLLDNINAAVSGEPELLQKSTFMMYDLKYKAVELMHIPLPGGLSASPTFEYAAPK